MGCFAYSPVEGAQANRLPGALPDEVREERRNRFMEVQAEISAEKLRAKIGTVEEVIIDEYDDEAGPCHRSDEGRLSRDRRQVLCRDPHALQAGRLREGPHHGQRGVRPRGHARRRGSDELIRPKRITQKASRAQETGTLEAFVVFGRRARKKVNTSFGENWK